ncbi:unnamed protein product [Parascedosporium putredinis]|uniref:methionyl-tRNA formyltransferase n=1 Tax=Parascedosporium putredinis TaxID=1442378 RepID=A0A9P1GWZ4_9PEZI|nr:unnamed protein product [Parascedosporium putredinis]CAI7990073.1 unnamed protein product [Parascedosporium putredinis]
MICQLQARTVSRGLRTGQFRTPRRAYSSRPPSDPLRILFCGSDEFSCASLRALDEERLSGSGLIQSIDVVVRPGKGTGRGYKTIREVPLKLNAERLGLPIHERDTFRGFEPPNWINLVIAVSFGLFVPPRILRMAKYGGLNLHPSYLPDLRGPAPLHHSLLERRSHIGITLQTLDEHKFDHGLILAQTPRPGISILPACTVPELTHLVTDPAARLLLDGLRHGVHVPPLADVRQATTDTASVLRHAPKVTKEDKRVNLAEWTAEDAVTRLRVLGPLWMEVVGGKKGKLERVILQDGEVVAEGRGEGSVEREVLLAQAAQEPRSEGRETVAMRYREEGDGAILLTFPRGGHLRVKQIVVGGKAAQEAAKALASLCRLT